MCVCCKNIKKYWYVLFLTCRPQAVSNALFIHEAGWILTKIGWVEWFYRCVLYSYFNAVLLRGIFIKTWPYCIYRRIFELRKAGCILSHSKFPMYIYFSSNIFCISKVSQFTFQWGFSSLKVFCQNMKINSCVTIFDHSPQIFAAAYVILFLETAA